MVSADFDNSSTKGFFMQAANCDTNLATSDGIFVHLGERIDIVSIGDLVEVNGTVNKNYSRTEICAAPGSVNLLSKDNPLLTLYELNPPYDNDLSRAYFESLEGMLADYRLGDEETQGEGEGMYAFSDCAVLLADRPL